MKLTARITKLELASLRRQHGSLAERLHAARMRFIQHGAPAPTKTRAELEAEAQSRDLAGRLARAALRCEDWAAAG
jgi:hypothetical protein